MGLSGNVSGSVGGSIIFDGGTGTDDYRELTHKPSINGVPLNGAMTSEDLHIPKDAVEDVKVNGNSASPGSVFSLIFLSHFSHSFNSIYILFWYP